MKPSIKIRRLRGHDWTRAFNEAMQQTQPAVPGADDVSLSQFKVEDIALVIGAEEGDKLHGSPWIITGQLHDGRWFYLEAESGQTSWEWCSSGYVSLASDKDTLLRFGMPQHVSKRLGLTTA